MINNIENGMNIAKGEIIGTIKYLINTFAVPVIAVGLLGVLIFFIIKAVTTYRQGQGISIEQITPIVLVIVGMVLIISFPAWGWALIGM